MTRVTTMAVVVLGAIALVAGIAVAHVDKFETKKVKIKHPSPETFTGKVKARGGCNADRTVKVTRVEEYGGGGDPLGTAKSDGSGEWTLTLPSPAKSGTYKAVAKKTSVEHGDELHKCKKATSKLITVG